MKFKNSTKYIKEYIIFLSRRTKSDMVLRVASSLGYTSMIAIVPLVAIALAIFSAFPVFDGVKEQIQTYIYSNLIPGSEAEVKYYFEQFVASTGKLTTVGVVGLALTALLMLSTIENSLNYIFRVHKPRSFVTKVMLYWTAITLGPLLIGTAVSLRGYLYAIETLMKGSVIYVGFKFSQILPSLLTLTGLMAIYVLVPNKRVKLKHALFGSIVAMILFAILRKTFGVFILQGSTYKTLYGALAVLPVFLIWMYLSWAVVIFGAVITASIPEWQEYRENKSEAIEEFKMIRSNYILYSISILKILKEARKTGKTVGSDDLYDQLELDTQGIYFVLEVLYQNNVITQCDDDKWVLSRDLSDLTVYDLIAIAGFKTYDENQNIAEISEVLDNSLRKLVENEKQILDLRLSTLFVD